MESMLFTSLAACSTVPEELNLSWLAAGVAGSFVDHASGQQTQKASGLRALEQIWAQEACTLWWASVGAAAMSIEQAACLLLSGAPPDSQQRTIDQLMSSRTSKGAISKHFAFIGSSLQTRAGMMPPMIFMAVWRIDCKEGTALFVVTHAYCTLEGNVYDSYDAGTSKFMQATTMTCMTSSTI